MEFISIRMLSNRDIEHIKIVTIIFSISKVSTLLMYLNKSSIYNNIISPNSKVQFYGWQIKNKSNFFPVKYADITSQENNIIIMVKVLIT